MESVADAISSPEFLAGLRWGTIAGAVALLVGLAWRVRQKALLPAAGIALTVAVFLAMPVARSVPTVLSLGLLLLLVAGVVSTVLDLGLLWGVVLSAPGAYVVAFQSETPGVRWVPWLILAVTVVGAAFGANFGRRHQDSGLGGLVLATTIAGAFLTLPDTEEILVFAGAALLISLLVWPRPLVTLGFGIFPLLGMLSWAIAWGGRGRESSLIGASACLGVLLVEPLAGRRRRPSSGWVIFLVHVGIVLIAARIAGLADDPIAAALISAAALAAGFVASWIVSRQTREIRL